MATTTLTRILAGANGEPDNTSAAPCDRWAGCWSIDDFSPAQRASYLAVSRHAYAWAAERVGCLGMENLDYVEDYAGWVARRHVELDFDDGALGAHTSLAAQWDRERAEAAAANVTSGAHGARWVGAMSGGRVLTASSLGAGQEGLAARRDLESLLAELGQVGVVVATVHSPEPGWRIERLDADRHPVQVWISDQAGPRFDVG